MQAFRKWKTALSEDGDERGTSDDREVIRFIKQLEPAVHSNHVKPNFNRSTAGGLPRGQFLTTSTENQQIAVTTRRRYVEKSRMPMISTGSAETFVVWPVAAKERAEEKQAFEQQQLPHGRFLKSRPSNSSNYHMVGF